MNILVLNGGPLNEALLRVATSRFCRSLPCVRSLP